MVILNSVPARLGPRFGVRPVTPWELKATNSLAGVSPAEAVARGGPLVASMTQQALKIVPRRPGCVLRVDVRIQRLRLGVTPKPVGWHGDNVEVFPGTNIPDVASIDTAIEHCSASLSTGKTGVSNTEFVLGPLDIDLDSRRAIWPQVQQHMEANANAQTFEVPDGVFAVYNSGSIHRARPAQCDGDRIFFRMVNTVRGAKFEWTVDDG